MIHYQNRKYMSTFVWGFMMMDTVVLGLDCQRSLALRCHAVLSILQALAAFMLINWIYEMSYS